MPSSFSAQPVLDSDSTMKSSINLAIFLKTLPPLPDRICSSPHNRLNPSAGCRCLRPVTSPSLTLSAQTWATTAARPSTSLEASSPKPCWRSQTVSSFFFPLLLLLKPDSCLDSFQCLVSAETKKNKKLGISNTILGQHGSSSAMRRINSCSEVSEVWSGLLTGFLSEVETLWCLRSQTVVQYLASLDSHWLVSALVFHGWLAAVFHWKTVAPWWGLDPVL